MGNEFQRVNDQSSSRMQEKSSPTLKLLFEKIFSHTISITVAILEKYFSQLRHITCFACAQLGKIRCVYCLNHQKLYDSFCWIDQNIKFKLSCHIKYFSVTSLYLYDITEHWALQNFADKCARFEIEFIIFQFQRISRWKLATYIKQIGIVVLIIVNLDI